MSPVRPSQSTGDGLHSEWNAGVSINVIEKGLDHSKVSTTETYLDELGSSGSAGRYHSGNVRMVGVPHL
jgi:hypothetical protein